MLELNSKKYKTIKECTEEMKAMCEKCECDKVCEHTITDCGIMGSANTLYHHLRLLQEMKETAELITSLTTNERKE